MKHLKIQLWRAWKTDISTIGILSVDWRFWCFTLENPLEKNGVKQKGKTAIPAGTYEVILKISPRTGLLTPWILNVPRYTNIQFHIGNFVKDTDGCPVVGLTRDGDNMIQRSRDAFKILVKQLVKADKISLTIV